MPLQSGHTFDEVLWAKGKANPPARHGVAFADRIDVEDMVTRGRVKLNRIAIVCTVKQNALIDFIIDDDEVMFDGERTESLYIIIGVKSSLGIVR